MANEETNKQAELKTKSQPQAQPDRVKEASSALAAQQRKKVRDQLKKENQQAKLNFRAIIKLYTLPIAVLTIFVAIVFALIIPGVAGMFATLEDISAKTDDIAKLDKRLVDFQNLANRSDQINADISAVEAVIPESITEVVNFQQRITRIAKQEYGLRVTQAETGETILSSAVESEDDPAAKALSIIEIPSTFSMTGSLPNIQNFISAVQQSRDFIIIGEMQLISLTDVNTQPISQFNRANWRLDITLVKYQFPVPNEQNKLEDIYAQVPPTVALNEQVLDYVREKVNL